MLNAQKKYLHHLRDRRSTAASWRAVLAVTFAVLAGSSIAGSPDRHASNQPKLLIFTATQTFRHTSIPDGVTALRSMAKRLQLDAEHTEDARAFSDEGLRDVALIVFLNTTGNVLDEPAQAAMQRYVQRGGAFLGFHSAADTELEWPWYQQLVGATFRNYPYGANGELRIQKARVYRSADVPCEFARLKTSWSVPDEWFNFRTFTPGIRTLMKLDTTTYVGRRHPGDHPVAWVHEFDGGRSGYLAFGDNSAVFKDRQVVTLIDAVMRYLLRRDTRRAACGR